VVKVIRQKAAAPPHTDGSMVHILYNGPPLFPSKLPLAVGYLDSIQIWAPSNT